MRTIDADALMELSKYEFWQDGSAITPIGEYILYKFRNLIRSMPTIEPDRKKGKRMRLTDDCIERIAEVVVQKLAKSEKET